MLPTTPFFLLPNDPSVVDYDLTLGVDKYSRALGQRDPQIAVEAYPWISPALRSVVLSLGYLTLVPHFF